MNGSKKKETPKTAETDKEKKNKTGKDNDNKQDADLSENESSSSSSASSFVPSESVVISANLEEMFNPIEYFLLILSNINTFRIVQKKNTLKKRKDERCIVVVYAQYSLDHNTV